MSLRSLVLVLVKGRGQICWNRSLKRRLSSYNINIMYHMRQSKLSLISLLVGFWAIDTNPTWLLCGQKLLWNNPWGTIWEIRDWNWVSALLAVLSLQPLHTLVYRNVTVHRSGDKMSVLGWVRKGKNYGKEKN